MLLRLVLLSLAAASSALVVSPARASLPASRAGVAAMRVTKVPSGPLGDYRKVGETGSWLGDRSQGTHIDKFERGEEFLFFQGPSPKTAIQDDLPSFFDLSSTLGNAEITPIMIVLAGTGAVSFAAVGSVLLGFSP